MSRLQKLKSDKKKMGLLISIMIIIIGVIPLLILTYIPDSNHPYRIEPLDLRSKDGTYISALKYTPLSGVADTGIVVGHGFCGNKIYMQPLCIELVKHGFVVINIDFRGHGTSGGILLESELVNDMKAAVDYLNNIMGITDVGLVGHSMGGSTASNLSRKYPDLINATVSIGWAPDNVTGISNLLLAVGLFEQIITPRTVVETIKLYTGLSDVELGKTYSDGIQQDFNPNSDNNTMGVVGYFSEHLFEVNEPTIVSKTIEWFELEFYESIQPSIPLTITILLTFFAISLIGVIALDFILIVYLSNYIFKSKRAYPEKEILKDARKVSEYSLMRYYLLASSVGFIFFLFAAPYLDFIFPIAQFGNLLSLILGGVVGMILVYSYFIMKRKQDISVKEFPLRIKQMCSVNPRRSLIYGILTAVLIILSVAAVGNWSTTNALPTPVEVGTIIGLTIFFFPIILIKEFYFRNIQGQLKTSSTLNEYFRMTGIGIFIETIFFILIALITWGSTNFQLAFIALSMTALILFAIIQQVLVTWIYMYSGRNILGSTMFLCITYAWMILLFFPFGSTTIA